MDVITIGLQIQYGPIMPGFEFRLPEKGYYVLSGKNNSGKSSILQFLFSRLVRDIQEVKADQVCLLMTDRQYVAESLETGTNNLVTYNTTFVNNIYNEPLSFNTYPGHSPRDLFKLLVSNTEFRKTLDNGDLTLETLGFPKMQLGPNGRILKFEGIDATFQGSGLRSVVAILAALTDPKIKYILIDEPELSIEPELQRIIRDEFFYKLPDQKCIVVSTHSHLFLNRKEGEIDHNYIVAKDSRGTMFSQIQSKAQLYELVFKLLGASPDDLFFPKNYLIVEGASDQELTNKILMLEGKSVDDYVVVSATSINQVDNIRVAFENTLKSKLIGSSIYKDKVVVLVDLPVSDEHKKMVLEFERNISGRVFKLDKPSLEEYIDDDLYVRAALNKGDELRKISIANSYKEKALIKQEIAKKISDVLTVDDLPKLQIIVDFIHKATEN